MKIKTIIAMTAMTLLSGNVFAMATSKLEHYIFKYDFGSTYHVELTDSTITWTGIAGPDKGLHETDALKRQTLSNDVEVLQWQEHSGDFVTVVFDRVKRKVISSGKSGEVTWLNQGNVLID